MVIDGADSFAEPPKVFRDLCHGKAPPRGFVRVIHGIQEFFVQFFKRVPDEGGSVELPALPPLCRARLFDGKLNQSFSHCLPLTMLDGCGLDLAGVQVVPCS